jgi:hypothetical protein
VNKNEDVEKNNVNFDLFGLQTLIALEQNMCRDLSEPQTSEDDPKQLKFQFDAAML